jgi:hypothetical protein
MKRAFISFDYDHDARLKDLLVGRRNTPIHPSRLQTGQSRLPRLRGELKPVGVSVRLAS